jgi:lipooligosaccharide transport system ATP-binding protein
VDSVIETDGLFKQYGDVVAVDRINLRVRRGECHGLLGPNGAGKTSVIRMAYGFSPISAGAMKVFGLDIQTHWREIRSRIGVCQQENTLDPDLSVEENLKVFAGYFLIPKATAKDRADDLLRFFALEKKRTAKVIELSGGMARRLTIARALINQPELVILDEPTTGLDPQSRHQLWDKILELRLKGTTLLLTTHYMEEAAHLCDRVTIMDRGRILEEGTPKDLIRLHAGESIIEIDGAGTGLVQFLSQEQVDYDVLGQKLIIYAQSSVGERILADYCPRSCTFRAATLEDVFLRLTGRELRE